MSRVPRSVPPLGLATFVVVGCLVPVRIRTWQRSEELARGHRCGWPQGSHWVWEGTPSPVQSDMVNTHPCGARHVRLGRRVIESNCTTWGRDGNSCWCRSGHSPLNVATELVVSLKTTTLFTVLLAASAAVAILTRSSCLSLMEKKAKLIAPLFCTHIRWKSRSANGMDPECTQALKLLPIRSVCSL